MYRKKISDAYTTFFNEAFTIYESSFPQEERRGREQQVALLQDNRYNFELIVQGDRCIGIFLWWLIGDYRYIEHFAIHPDVRNAGIGRSIISEFITQSEMPVVLEVEKPTDSLTIRRIYFYKRQGFQYADCDYAHPPFVAHSPFVQLRLMSFPHVFDEDDVACFIDTTHPIVHRVYFEDLHRL